MRILTHIFAFLAMVALCSSCNDKKDEPEVLAKRTIVVYMVATNSMSGQDNTDIAEMKTALSGYSRGDCRLILYRVSYNQAPQLLEISSKNDIVTTATLKTYSEEQSASVTKQRFSEVMADVKAFAPSDDYGLVLWSHAAGWANSLPKSVGARPRYFGIDYNATMPIDSLADAIPAGMFSFIYADACYMGGIEVAYQLRNKTRYFVGSPAEIPYDGMPYDVTIPLFFEDNVSLSKICDKVYEYYRNSTSGVALSIVDCAKLDALAAVCRDIHSTAKELESAADLQYYNRAPITSVRLFYDFGQYTRMIAGDDSLVEQFNVALDDAVIYKISTPSVFGISINADTFSGLSTSIYGTNAADNDAYYETLDWYRDVIKK